MLIVIPQVIDRAKALELGVMIAQADWVDGNETSGETAALAKKNQQLPAAGAAAAQARKIVQNSLAQAGKFLSAALPRRIYPPLFNRYAVGDGFANHIDNAIRVDPATGTQMRTDLSATLFLSEDYDGGELVIEGASGTVSHKHEAGDLLLYSASTIHRVLPVTRGERIASFFWIESLVRDCTARDMLFELDQSIQTLGAERGGNDPEVLRLSKVYHNLVRRWSA